jgi:hypothetical protein
LVSITAGHGRGLEILPVDRGSDLAAQRCEPVIKVVEVRQRAHPARFSKRRMAVWAQETLKSPGSRLEV